MRDDEGTDPSQKEYTGPRSPTDDGMLVLVLRIFEKAEKYQTGRNRCVQDAQEDECRDHERESDLLVDRLQRSKGWGSHVLGAHERVHNGADEAKDDNFANGAQPKRLWKITRLFHLRDEGGQRDLPNKSIADVEKGTQTRDKCRAGEGHGEHLGGTVCCAVACWVRLNAGKDDGEEDGDEGEARGDGTKLRQGFKGPR